MTSQNDKTAAEVLATKKQSKQAMSDKGKAPAKEESEPTETKNISGSTRPPKTFIPPSTIPEDDENGESSSMALVLHDGSSGSDETPPEEENESTFPAYPFPEISSNYTLLDQIHMSAYDEQATKPAMDNNGRLREYYFEPKWGQTGIVAPSRHLKARVPKDVPIGNLKKIFETDGVLYMSYFDLRASLKCYAKLGERYGLKYCARSILENLQGHDAVYPVMQEGTVHIDILSNTKEDKDCEAQILTDVMHLVGPIIAITSPVFTTHSPEYTVEFADVRDAKAAIELFRSHLIRGLHIVCRYSDIERHRWVVADQMIEIHEHENICRVSATNAQLISDQRREEKRRNLRERRCSELEEGGCCTPHNKHCNPNQSNKNLHMQLARFNERGNQKDHTPNKISNENIVDLATIKAGKDPRTTLMVRNIPNKLGQETVLSWLDETSFRSYDFAYLRIDFSNGCNMGYCFVNFLTLNAMVHFLEQRVGASWQHYNSDKRVTCLYADMQGKATCIARFRNSSVMDQVRSCRPLAFHSDGPDIGLEMEFPAPDNLGQKLRSVTSAAANGLYRKGRNNYNNKGRNNGKFNNGNNSNNGHNGNQGNNGRGNGGWQNQAQNGQRGFNNQWQNHNKNNQRDMSGNWQNQPNNAPRGLITNGNNNGPRLMITDGTENGNNKNHQTLTAPIVAPKTEVAITSTENRIEPVQNTNMVVGPVQNTNMIVGPVQAMVPFTPYHNPAPFAIPQPVMFGTPQHAPFAVPQPVLPTVAPPVHGFYGAPGPFTQEPLLFQGGVTPAPRIPLWIPHQQPGFQPQQPVLPTIQPVFATPRPVVTIRKPDPVPAPAPKATKAVVIQAPVVEKPVVQAPAIVRKSTPFAASVHVTEEGSPVRSPSPFMDGHQIMDEIDGEFHDFISEWKANRSREEPLNTPLIHGKVIPATPMTRAGKSVESVETTPDSDEEPTFHQWLRASRNAKNQRQNSIQVGGSVAGAVQEIISTPTKLRTNRGLDLGNYTPRGQFRSPFANPMNGH
ncbi:hypothetical protein Dda_0962 [Drechslerella dactyloides]|uniref:Mei2-like C-terminal RNA recognition motif domain-containing protein n=1 Tax=Drechslerella dactyloides TaxID=74499 RepID=A0AAD6J768_DREDA|nr:hypothetical protein Dda_0962 [Drechslerella dactyloides]